jgi:hypothetical protein
MFVLSIPENLTKLSQKDFLLWQRKQVYGSRRDGCGKGWNTLALHIGLLLFLLLSFIFNGLQSACAQRVADMKSSDIPGHFLFHL